MVFIQLAGNETVLLRLRDPRNSSETPALFSLSPFAFQLRKLSIGYSLTFYFNLFSFFFFLGLHPWHMEVPRLGVKLELQLPAYATATVTWDPSHFCNLHHSSRQRWILNPLSEARDRTHILMDINWILNPLSHNGSS